MPHYLSVLLVIAVSATVAGRPLIAPQRALPPRQVAVAWLTAKTVADAVRHLPPATVEQFRTFQKNATPERQVLVNAIEPMLAPLVFSQLMGSTLTTSGSPVSIIRLRGSQTLHLSVLDASITGESATVTLRVGTTAGGPSEPGAIELRRDGGVWRIVAANLGPSITLARFDLPDYIQTATVLAIEEFQRDRARQTELMVTGRLRALISAQLVYAAHNNGFFAPPDCLTDVAKCGRRPNLDPPPLAPGALDLRGYSSRFYPGAKPSAAEIGTASAQSVKTWAHVFSPTDAAANVGALCGDSTGRVCRVAAGRLEITGGACPATCVDMK